MNTFIYNLAPLDLLQIGTAYTAVFPSAIAARLILNLRAAFKVDVQCSKARTSEWETWNGETLELRARRSEGTDLTEPYST